MNRSYFPKSWFIRPNLFCPYTTAFLILAVIPVMSTRNFRGKTTTGIVPSPCPYLNHPTSRERLQQSLRSAENSVWALISPISHKTPHFRVSVSSSEKSEHRPEHTCRRCRNYRRCERASEQRGWVAAAAKTHSRKGGDWAIARRTRRSPPRSAEYFDRREADNFSSYGANRDPGDCPGRAETARRTVACLPCLLACLPVCLLACLPACLLARGCTFTSLPVLHGARERARAQLQASPEQGRLSLIYPDSLPVSSHVFVHLFLLPFMSLPCNFRLCLSLANLFRLICFFWRFRNSDHVYAGRTRHLLLASTFISAGSLTSVCC